MQFYEIHETTNIVLLPWSFSSFQNVVAKFNSSCSNYLSKVKFLRGKLVENFLCKKLMFFQTLAIKNNQTWTVYFFFETEKRFHQKWMKVMYCTKIMSMLML